MALQRSRAPPPRGVLLKVVLSLFSVLDVGFWNLGWEIERGLSLWDFCLIRLPFKLRPSRCLCLALVQGPWVGGASSRRLFLEDGLDGGNSALAIGF